MVQQLSHHPIPFVKRGGRLFRSDPPCRKQFGEPLTNPWGIQLEKSEQKPELPVVRLGYTFVTHEEQTTSQNMMVHFWYQLRCKKHVQVICTKTIQNTWLKLVSHHVTPHVLHTRSLWVGCKPKWRSDTPGFTPMTSSPTAAIISATRRSFFLGLASLLHR